MPMLVAMMSHEQKSWCTSFEHLDVRMAVVHLMMLLASCDTDASANGSKWMKSLIAPHFSHLDQRNPMLQLITLLESHDANEGINGITWLKTSYCTSWNGTIDDAVHITMLTPVQWHYVTPMPMASFDANCMTWQKVMLHFMSIVLT